MNINSFCRHFFISLLTFIIIHFEPASFLYTFTTETINTPPLSPNPPEGAHRGLNAVRAFPSPIPPPESAYCGLNAVRAPKKNLHNLNITYS